MLRKPLFWIAVVILLAAAGGGFYYYKTTIASAQAAATPDLQTSTVRTGEIILSASGVGSLVADQEMNLGFKSSGILSELKAKIGDTVKKGDVLAVMVSADSEVALQVAVSSAQLSVLKAQQAYDDLATTNAVNLVQEQADTQVSLLTAQDDLVDLKKERADMEYLRCDPDVIEDYQTTYDRALKFYNRRPDDSRAQDQLETAQANLEFCLTPYSAEEKALAEANVKAKEAEIQVYQDTLAQLANGTLVTDLTVAQAELELAKAQLVEAQEALEPQQITAPFDGIVTAIDAKVGESVSSTPIITVIATGTPTLQLYVDESDIAMLQLGGKISVTFNSLPDATYTGHVTQIYPSLSSVEGVNVVTAIAQLDPVEGVAMPVLPIGSNATVEVIQAQTAADALIIPIEALRDLGDGTYAVFVMDNGEPVLRVVTIGLQDATSVEITSGLQQGEVVSTGIMETVQ